MVRVTRTTAEAMELLNRYRSALIRRGRAAVKVWRLGADAEAVARVEAADPGVPGWPDPRQLALPC